MELNCDRCGKGFIKGDISDICTSVPPDREQRFHTHHHRWDHKSSKCLTCQVVDDRMIFG